MLLLMLIRFCCWYVVVAVTVAVDNVIAYVVIAIAETMLILFFIKVNLYSDRSFSLVSNSNTCTFTYNRSL